MVKYTVFANFYIDTEERYLRMKDSFFSFYKSNVYDWNINIRGKYKNKVKIFLQENISKNLNIFFLESKKGWVFDTLNISNYFKTNIIFFWIEDHICIDSVSKINSVVAEMHKNKIDHLIYSFFHKGIYINQLNAVNHEVKKNILFFRYGKKNYRNLKSWYKKENHTPSYLIAACSFMSLNLFKKNLSLSKTKKKYNPMLPFNFEKSFDENKILPFNAGVLKKELFVSIDDNHGEQGYSLISRKKYPKRVSKKQLDEIRKIKIRIFAQNPLKKTIEKFFTLFK
jgi:hypothetical protein